MKKQLTLQDYGSRLEKSHKGTHGKTLMIGGSLKYPGALLLSGLAALSSGTGYVTFGVTKEIYDVVAARLPEVTYELIDEKDTLDFYDKVVSNYNSVLFGNGLINNKCYQDLLTLILNKYEGKLTIDATGLDILKTIGLDKLRSSEAKVVLTPHLGEFRRVFDIDENQEDLMRVITSLCQEYNVVMDVKSDCSYIVSKDYGEIVHFGNSGLAKAGSGDVLAGLVSGYRSFTSHDDYVATYLAHLLLGETIDYMVSQKSPHSVRVSKIPKYVGIVLKKFGN